LQSTITPCSLIRTSISTASRFSATNFNFK
jgi:hypothetical protein